MKIGTSLVDPATGQELMYWDILPRSFTTPAGEFRTGAIEGAQIDGTYLLVGRYANDPPSPYATVSSEAGGVYDGSNPDQLKFTVTRVYKDQPPPPPPVPQIISDRQFFQQLAATQVITQDEALAAVGPGTLPAALENLIAGLPADQQFPAHMLLKGAVQFDRRHPMVAVLGGGFGWTDAQLDALWIAASLL